MAATVVVWWTPSAKVSAAVVPQVLPAVVHVQGEGLRPRGAGRRSALPGSAVHPQEPHRQAREEDRAGDAGHVQPAGERVVRLRQVIFSGGQAA